MVNEKILQFIFIPLLGLTISVYIFLSGLREPNLQQGLVYFASFILLSHIGILSASSNIQRTRNKATRITLKTILLNAFSCGMITAAGILCWQWITPGQVKFIPVLYCIGISMVLTIIFTLVHEIIFLRNEKLVNDKVVQHLDKELLDAEINLLKNELDPHFVYNTLMPLYYLVKTDRSTAEQFACKLIQVYQYFLQNRNNDFISVKEELEFIDNYIFLLRIRYKDSLEISFTNTESVQWQMILPFSLQLLIENAIKHNHFDQEHPLCIRISAEKGYLQVSNHVNYKKDIIYSSRIGLKNLRTRYKILCKQNIIVSEHKEQFIVKLPLNQSLKMNDSYHYYRGRSN